MTTQLTIDFLGVELEVEGSYDPGEPSRTSGPPEDCYEGSPSYFEIEDILVGGVSILEMFQCFSIPTNSAPIRHRDALQALAEIACQMCDEMEPEVDDPPEPDYAE